MKEIDAMVANRYRKACREASGLDFETLRDDEEVFVKTSMTPYIDKLESFVGEIGIKVLGRKVWQRSWQGEGNAIDLVKGYDKSLEKGIGVVEHMFGNSGNPNEESHGKVELIKSENNEIIIRSTNLMNDFYVMGVIESIIAGYGHWPTKSERTKKRPESPYSEFYFKWQ